MSEMLLKQYTAHSQRGGEEDWTCGTCDGASCEYCKVQMFDMDTGELVSSEYVLSQAERDLLLSDERELEDEGNDWGNWGCECCGGETHNGNVLCDDCHKKEHPDTTDDDWGGARNTLKI